MRTVLWAKNKWLEVAERFNFPKVIVSDDIRRGSMLAVFVMVLLDDTDLVYSSIASCLWGLRVWLSLQHQADPIMGVMGWADFMAAVRVLSWVPAEPRRAVCPLGVSARCIEVCGPEFLLGGVMCTLHCFTLVHLLAV